MISQETYRAKNLEQLDTALHISYQGSYIFPEQKTVTLTYTYNELCRATVLAENDVAVLSEQLTQSDDISSSEAAPAWEADSSFLAKSPDSARPYMQRCCFRVENTDSFQAACQLYDGNFYDMDDDKERILVLNFANPIHPGGGVRRGAKAQEEDLCRQSTLLASLESECARPYYEANRRKKDYMGSDAMIFSPNVEIFIDSQGRLKENPTPVSVLTCAAPMLNKQMRHTQTKTLDGLETLLYQRICGILRTAAFYGCRYLVLGAWGCGAFGNDAQMIARLFHKAFKELTLYGLKPEHYFRQVIFAVLDRTRSQYNYKSFLEYFEDFYEGNVMAPTNNSTHIAPCAQWQDKIRGCLIGGAAGDALGYTVEFWNSKKIHEIYGEQGITQYEPDPKSDLAIISDDTQMVLFTASGILQGMAQKAQGAAAASLESCIYDAYLDWLHTQTASTLQSRSKTAQHPGHEPAARLLGNTAHPGSSTAAGQPHTGATAGPQHADAAGYSHSRHNWLLDIPELYQRRAPGRTCLNALETGRMGTIENPLNNSKGCGGIMRVAPIALYDPDPANIDTIAIMGAKAAAITHGHPLGYMSSAALVYVIHRIVYGGCSNGSTLYAIVSEMRSAMPRLFPGNPYLRPLLAAIDKAVELSRNSLPDEKNILMLGQGWVAEETLAIALYCSLKYQNDFSKALMVSVNHSGDSDSTGAVTGNILGALIGYTNIPRQWKRGLELHRAIIKIADELYEAAQEQL